MTAQTQASRDVLTHHNCKPDTPINKAVSRVAGGQLYHGHLHDGQAERCSHLHQRGEASYLQPLDQARVSQEGGQQA